MSLLMLESTQKLRMALQAKDEYPLCYTSSASGHVSAGENYDETAPRELEEELGLTTPVERLADFPAGPETANEFTVLYRTITDIPPQFDPGEIAGGAFYELAEIEEWLEREPDQFSPPFRICFRWYQQWLKDKHNT